MGQVRTILDQLSSVIVATSVVGAAGDKLQPCDYRYPLDKQPQGGAHRRFELLATATRLSPRGLFGAGYTAVEIDARIRVYYFRGGGDAGGGDRKQIQSQAGTDGMRIADALTMPPAWGDQSVTTIRVVSMLDGGGFARVADGDKFEIYETRLKVEANLYSPLPQVFA